jgi:UDP-N-acetylglucosamine:LPS N-acetylglucosamine transferase
MHELDEHTWRHIFQSNEPPSRAVVDALRLICSMCPATLPIAGEDEIYASDRIVYPILRTALPSASGGMRSRGVLRWGVVHWVWRTLGRRMAQCIQRFAPDVIVSTQMLPAALLSSIKHRRSWRIPSVGVLTDYGIHDFWLQQQTDHYCVAHEEIANVKESGLEPYCVSYTGVPLMPGFASPPSQLDARRALGLEVETPIVLVLGGGLGLGIETLTQQLLALPAPTRLVVLIGRNVHAAEQLCNLRVQHADRLKVLGWTDSVQCLMRAADIVVGKPGGLTVAEVLACGRPLFAIRSLGGQEGFNLRFLERHGVGRLVSEDALVPLIHELLQAPQRLRELQDLAWALGRRHGAERVAEIAQRFASVPSRVALGSC